MPASSGSRDADTMLPQDYENIIGRAFSATDFRRLEHAIRDARLSSTTMPAELLDPNADVAGARAAAVTAAHCVFDHCAVLLFPQSLDGGLRDLERCGLDPLPLVPSTVVRRRVSERYGLDADRCGIHLTRLRVDLPNGRRHAAVEVFLFPKDSAEHSQRIEDSEIAHEFERHTAFELARPAARTLAELVAAWRAGAGLLWEGGGHNPHEGDQGSTVLYFVRDGAHPAHRRRFELHCAGDLRACTDRLDMEIDAVNRAYAAWRPAVADSLG
jgi:hypothetical protein